MRKRHDSDKLLIDNALNFTTPDKCALINSVMVNRREKKRGYESRREKGALTRLKARAVHPNRQRLLLDVRKQIFVNHKVSYAVRMVFIKGITFTPLTNGRDVNFGNFRTHTPCHLERRAFFVVTRARC